MVKKIISLFLSILMTFSVIAVNANSVYAADANINTETYSKNEIAYYDRSADFLATMGVIQNVKEYDTSISRSEFAYTLLALMGYDDPSQVQDEIQKFTDSDAKAADNGIINMITDYGLMSFFDNGTFSKDEDLTYDDAVKGLVCVLGYRILAEENGGNINGYISTANKIKLLKNVDAELGYAVSANNYIKLLMNALEVDMMVKELGSKNEYYIDYGNTILYNVLNLIEGEGVVNANAYTDFSGGDGVSNGKISIGNTVYDYNGGYTDLLGYNVEFYKDASTKEIVYLSPVDNIEKVIDGEDVISYSDRVYTYYGENGNKKETETLSVGCKVVYNGKVSTDNYHNPIIWRSDNCTLKFVDNNMDNVWDVLFIDVYKICVVDYNDSINEIITDKYKANNVEYSGCETVLAYNPSGKEGTASDVKPGQVVSVLMSADNKLVKMYISKTAVTGEVEFVLNNSDGTKDVIVKGETYKTRGSNDDINEIAVGQKYTFYLDIDGRIVSCIHQLSLDTAFMIDATIVGVMDKVVKLKVFDSTSVIKTLQCADRVTYNGTTYKSGSSADHIDLFRALPKEDDGVEVVSQPITYELNSEGKISSFNTAQDESDKIRFLNEVAKDTEYRTDGLCFADGKSYLTDNAIIYAVPHKDKIKTASEDYFYVMDPKTALRVNTNAYTSTSTDIPRRMPQLYQVGTTKIGSNLVVMDSYIKMRSGGMGIVAGKATMVDEDGVECIKLTINHSGSVDVYYAYDALMQTAQTIDVGDVVSTEARNDGASRRVLRTLTLRYDISEKHYTGKTGDYKSDERSYMADVYDKDGSFFAMVETTDGSAVGNYNNMTSAGLIYGNMSQAKIYKYESQGREPMVSTASVNDLAPYVSVGNKASKVFVFLQKELPKLVYIVM